MIDCNNVSIKVRPLMVPAATVSLKMSRRRRAKAIPARTNGLNSKM